MPWATKEDARASTWIDAKTVPDAVLDDLLAAAQEQCQEYAPTMLQGTPVPVRYKLATILQARELWAAAKRDGDVISGDTYVIRARDLTATVRQLLRPKRGLPGVG